MRSRTLSDGIGCNRAQVITGAAVGVESAAIWAFQSPHPDVAERGTLLGVAVELADRTSTSTSTSTNAIVTGHQVRGSGGQTSQQPGGDGVESLNVTIGVSFRSRLHRFQ